MEPKWLKHCKLWILKEKVAILLVVSNADIDKKDLDIFFENLMKDVNNLKVPVLNQKTNRLIF